MPIKKLPRPRIQRAFVRWLNENQHCFMVPTRISKINAKGVELYFHNYPECLSVWLTSNELSVHVEWQENYWDCLIDLDASPFHTLGGYQCKRCVHEGGKQVMVFPSREALWKDHLFEPFLKWVNEKLAPARWLQLSVIGDYGFTWAQLLQDETASSDSDPTLHLMQQLKRLDGKPIYDGDAEGVMNLIIALKPDTSCLKTAKAHRGVQI